MRISDWSSDVCSSDLAGSGRDQVRHLRNGAGSMSGKTISFGQALNAALDDAMADEGNVMILGEDVADEQGGGVFKVSKGLSSKYGTSIVRSTPISDRKRVVWGMSVSVRVVLGGRGFLKKKIF